MNIILIIALIATCVNWMKWKVTTKSIVLYMRKKGYAPPTNSESEACAKEVIRKMLQVK